MAKGDSAIFEDKDSSPKIKIASLFAKEFEIPIPRAAAILDDVAGVAILESKRAKSLTFPGVSKMIISKTPGTKRVGSNLHFVQPSRSLRRG